MIEHVAASTASAEQQLADAIRERIALLRIIGFQTRSGKDLISGEQFWGWVRTWSGVCSVVVVAADQESIAYQIRSDRAPADLLMIDPDLKIWSVAGSFLRCSQQLLDRVGTEPGTFPASRSHVVDQPPYH